MSPSQFNTGDGLVPVEFPIGAWVVWDRDNGPYARAIYHTEIDALRRINVDGYGKVCFWPFGTELSHATELSVRPHIAGSTA